MSSSQRLSGFEGVSSAVAETLPGIEFIGWFVLSAPSGTSPDVVSRINQEMDAIMRDPELVKRLHELGFYTDGAGSVASVAEFVDRQREEWSLIVREIGLNAE